MAYNGTVDLISGIRQKNGGNFPLVDATAVRVDDATRLDAALDGIEIDSRLLNEAIKNTRQVVVRTNGVITGVQHIDGNNVVVRTDTFSVNGDLMVETRTLNAGMTLTISTDKTTLTSTVTYTAN